MATTPRKDPQPNISDLRDHSQSIFRPILTRIRKKKKKSCHPYLGAGKHPSPLGRKKKKKKKKKKKDWKTKLFSSLPSRKFLNYQKILFLSKVILVFLPAPIYKVKYVRDHIQIDIYRDEFFCGQKGGISVATIYKIER